MRSILEKARSLIAALGKPGGPRPGGVSEPDGGGEFDERLLAVLACPSSHEALRYDPEARELVADQAGLAYPVVDGIPILLAGEARPARPGKVHEQGPPF